MDAKVLSLIKMSNWSPSEERANCPGPLRWRRRFDGPRQVVERASVAKERGETRTYHLQALTS